MLHRSVKGRNSEGILDKQHKNCEKTGDYERRHR